MDSWWPGNSGIDWYHRSMVHWFSSDTHSYSSHLFWTYYGGSICSSLSKKGVQIFTASHPCDRDDLNGGILQMEHATLGSNHIYQRMNMKSTLFL